MGKLRNAIIKIRNKYNQWCERRKLKFTDFSIISNNCWAATAVYQPFGLKYNTPTVGLFFMDEDYILFLENLDSYLSSELKFIDVQESKYYDKITSHGTKPVAYPIARLGGDIEIHFMHYHNAEEAAAKWHRRAARLNRQRLIIKMSLRDSGYDVNEMLKRFKALKFKNKICFTPDSDDPDNGIIHVPELAQLNLIGGDETEYTLRKINVYKLLNLLGNQ